jgi:cytochrome oxidase Cu insertion factor (SCO1/SenC/PrrC family)
VKPAIVLASAFVLLTGCMSGPSLPSYGVVPDFILTDQGGAAFDSRGQLDGKVWVANFIFTSCAGPCPRMSSQFRKLAADIPERPDFRLVSFTIDPARDTPETLAAYGKRYGADGARWTLLTGAAADLQKLSLDTFHLATIDGSLEHGTRFALVDRKSRIRGFYDSTDKEKLTELVRDIQSLLKDKA